MVRRTGSGMSAPSSRLTAASHLYTWVLWNGNQPGDESAFCVIMDDWLVADGLKNIMVISSFALQTYVEAYW